MGSTFEFGPEYLIPPCTILAKCVNLVTVAWGFLPLGSVKMKAPSSSSMFRYRCRHVQREPWWSKSNKNSRKKIPLCFLNIDIYWDLDTVANYTVFNYVCTYIYVGMYVFGSSVPIYCFSYRKAVKICVFISGICKKLTENILSIFFTLTCYGLHGRGEGGKISPNHVHDPL